MNSRQETGRLGELAARRHLQVLGWTIIAANARCGRNEIDIVADDNGTLVFVEVRARRGRMFGAPEESITPSQAAADAQSSAVLPDDANEWWNRRWRIDMVAVELDRHDGVATAGVSCGTRLKDNGKSTGYSLHALHALIIQFAQADSRSGFPLSRE